MNSSCSVLNLISSLANSTRRNAPTNNDKQINLFTGVPPAGDETTVFGIVWNECLKHSNLVSAAVAPAIAQIPGFNSWCEPANVTKYLAVAIGGYKLLGKCVSVARKRARAEFQEFNTASGTFPDQAGSTPVHDDPIAFPETKRPCMEAEAPLSSKETLAGDMNACGLQTLSQPVAASAMDVSETSVVAIQSTNPIVEETQSFRMAQVPVAIRSDPLLAIRPSSTPRPLLVQVLKSQQTKENELSDVNRTSVVIPPNCLIATCAQRVLDYPTESREIINADGRNLERRVVSYMHVETTLASQ